MTQALFQYTRLVIGVTLFLLVFGACKALEHARRYLHQRNRHNA